MIRVKKFVFNSVAENTYVVYNDEKDAVIIDCGCMDEHEQKLLKTFIEDNHLCPHALLNTHLHFDHTWGAAYVLQQWPQMQAYAHRYEVELMPSPSRQLAMFGISDRFSDISTDRLHYVEDQDEISFGKLKFQVRYVPGHSPGHVAFYCSEAGIVFSGDVLFRQDIGRADLWGGNLDTLLESIRSQLFTLPDNTIVYSGHGPETTIQYEKQFNPYLI